MSGKAAGWWVGGGSMLVRANCHKKIIFLQSERVSIPVSNQTFCCSGDVLDENEVIDGRGAGCVGPTWL